MQRIRFTCDDSPLWSMQASGKRIRIRMFEHVPERRRYIRSRADLEFQLARITLALSRARASRRAETLDWFEDAGEGLIAKSAAEHREYVAERVASIRETFFGLPAMTPAHFVHDARMRNGMNEGRRLQ